MDCFLAYDAGTSSVKAILVDKSGNILATAVEEYPLHMPHPGWAEQDPQDYWQAICKSTKQLVTASSVSLHEIKGIAFTTQAMGLIPVDKEGSVLYPNISWVDGRAEKQALSMMRKVGGKWIFTKIVGVEITGKDVIPKMVWLKEHRRDIFDATYKFLDVNGYLRYKCTGRMTAEWSGACSYSFNLSKKDWERFAFTFNGIDTEKLPDLVRSVDEVGKLTKQAALEMGLCEGIPVYGGCDDTQSAAVGTTAIGEGQAHIYTGTSAWVGVMTARPRGFKNGLFCLQSADPKMNIVVGITESAGVNTEWLIRNFYAHEMKVMTSAALFDLVEEEVKQTPAGAEYLVLTPWFLGERCPVSTTTTRSTIFNLSHQHTRAHIARAHFEGIAYNLRWSIHNLEKDFGFDIRELKITGGGSLSRTWMQIIADVTQRKIITTSQAKNAGALGAAMCAMVGSGTFASFSEIQRLIRPVEEFVPNPDTKNVYDALYNTYQQLYHNLKHSYAEINQQRFQIG